MRLANLALALVGLALVAAGWWPWRRARRTGLGTSAPMAAGALVVAGLCCLVIALRDR